MKESIETLYQDPILQLLVFVVLVIGVVDAYKFMMCWLFKKIVGDSDETDNRG
tara:strand:- start:616 stop:774 length:159 start_codon:yes stop_codon:yes gene_type:complete